MASSDFFTGAFPAEYGNALSGVFDINLRKGNQFKREHTFQAGVIGLDFASEGPFKKDGKSTYLFNYRYSTFGLIQPVLPDDANKINYQDLSFKLHFPTKAGTFELWGLGGLDDANSNKFPTSDSTKWETQSDFTRLAFAFDIGTLGLNHKYNLGEKAFLKTTFATSVNNSFYDEDVMDTNGMLHDYNSIDQKYLIFNASTQLNVKHSRSWNTRSGFIYSRNDNYINIEAAPDLYENPVKVSEDNNIYNRYQVYFQSQHFFGSQIQLNVGFNTQYSELVDEITFEPRVSLSYLASPVNRFSIGYGQHSMLEDNKIYTAVDENGDLVNKDLKITKARHLVFSWDHQINDLTHIKVEPYYQQIYDVPVIPDSSFSMLNFTQDWFFNGYLESDGKGRNYGIDLTLERFFNNNFYYLVTGSVFKSEYLDGNGEWHDTRFDRGYSFDILAGKEWFRGGQKNKLLGLNFRLNTMGGLKTSPLNEEASLEAQHEVLDWNQPFTIQDPMSNILDVTLTLRKNKAKSSSEWAFQFKNILGAKTSPFYEYNFKTGEMEKFSFAIIVPNISYKIEF